ncbi:MAG: FAD-binding oxidoreductase [Gammaproteobacteria bacterium]|nr:FAD-binding oxidoreductase [Gammaproteobacteria bacterium]
MSFCDRVRPASVVRVGSGAEVQKLIRFANETRTTLVPISSGAPHFRGDTVPGAGGAIVVDLSGMKRIQFVDRERRVAMCEPGVSFGELIAATRAQGLRLNMPLLPRAGKSVVGSILEREPVTMPKYQWDVSDPLACAGLYFGNGEEFRTGQAAGPGTIEEQWKVGGVQKAPYGPGTASWHRLIQGAQGTMGIVTWVSMRCELLPTLQEPYVLGGEQLQPLLELAYWLVRLRAVNECFILNATNLAGMFAPPGEQALVRAGLPAWTLFYTVAGYEYFPEQRVAAHLSEIGEVAQRLGLSPARAVGGLSAHTLLRAVQAPGAEPYWKLRERGACEDVFYLTVRERLAGQIEALGALATQAGHAASELGVYIQPIVQGTGYHCEFNLFYDPSDRPERERVRGLAEAAVRGLMERGAFFSRPYGPSAARIVNRDAATLQVLHTIKKIFDPNHVMNPGKVCF